jgi:Putative auto-transporter adhesin, head GIN domain
MKKTLFFFAILVTYTGMAQWNWEKIEGNGQLKKETRSIGEFSSIGSSGSWDVMVAYGTTNSIQVEADENLIPYIVTEVEGNKLSIHSKKNTNLRSRNKIVVYVTMSNLTGLSLSGSGSVMGEGKFSSDGPLQVSISGSGNIKMGFNSAKSVIMSIAGSGNIQLAGKAENAEVSISGSGNADCGNLQVDKVNARISGSGNVKIFANNSVKANISGSGSVVYKGPANDIESHTAGSGRISRASN